MSDSHRFCQLQDRHAPQGLNASQIAREVARDRRTGASWLTQDHFRPRKPRPHVRKLAPVNADLVRRLARHPSAAAPVCQRLGERGFTGSDALVKASVRTVRPRRQPALLPLALAPGACAQGDWGAFGAVPVGHTHRPRRFLVMVLCSSRLRSGACTVSQTMDHFWACHPQAWDVFGGIPQTRMVAHLQSAVLQRAGGAAPGLHPQSADFATHHGLTSTPCHVGKGQEKGRVDNGVGSVKKPCLAGRALPAFSALKPAARHWLATVANGRVPGETRQQPTGLWQTARPALRPVPRHPFAMAPVSQVRASRPCRVPGETNRSAVPAPYAGHALILQTSPDRRWL
jgi:transposase